MFATSWCTLVRNAQGLEWFYHCLGPNFFHSLPESWPCIKTATNSDIDNETIIIMTILISLSLSLLYIIIFTSIIIVTLALFFFELWNNKWELMLIFFTDSSTDLDQTIQEITSEIDPLKSKHSTLVSTKDRYQLTDPKLNLKSDGWRCYLKIILRELKRLTLNHKKRWSLVKLEQDWNHLNPSPPSSWQWEENAPCLIVEKEFKIV